MWVVRSSQELNPIGSPAEPPTMPLVPKWGRARHKDVEGLGGVCMHACPSVSVNRPTDLQGKDRP